MPEGENCQRREEQRGSNINMNTMDHIIRKTGMVTGGGWQSGERKVIYYGYNYVKHSIIYMQA